jgi:hypothetical protein
MNIRLHNKYTSTHGFSVCINATPHNNNYRNSHTIYAQSILWLDVSKQPYKT